MTLARRQRLEAVRSMARFNIAGVEFYDEEETSHVMKKEISSLRSDAARRRGPPRISEGNCILYRADALRDWLISREVNYDDVRDKVRQGEDTKGSSK